MNARPDARVHAAQFELAFAPVALPARAASTDAGDAAALLASLRALGLRGIARCCLTSNRTVMVSFRGAELRVHRTFCSAPRDVLQAIVTFVQGRGPARRRARRLILSYQVDTSDRAPRRRLPTHPDDSLLAARLAQMHARSNRELFDGCLTPAAIRVSRRMRAALGSYHPARAGDAGAEIVISRRHIRRHGWAAARETLLHEMVHQWQDESGLPLDHGASFRGKARQVGITASARRRPERLPPNLLSRSA